MFGVYKLENSYKKGNLEILDGESKFYYIGQVMVQEFYTDGKLNAGNVN